MRKSISLVIYLLLVTSIVTWIIAWDIIAYGLGLLSSHVMLVHNSKLIFFQLPAVVLPIQVWVLIQRNRWGAKACLMHWQMYAGFLVAAIAGTPIYFIFMRLKPISTVSIFASIIILSVIAAKLLVLRYWWILFIAPVIQRQRISE